MLDVTVASVKQKAASAIDTHSSLLGQERIVRVVFRRPAKSRISWRPLVVRQRQPFSERGWRNSFDDALQFALVRFIRFNRLNANVTSGGVPSIVA